MADLIHFPRLFGGDFAALSPDHVAKFAQQSALRGWHRNPCANGMPGHPPCRSPAELERLLRERADTAACREGG